MGSQDTNINSNTVNIEPEIHTKKDDKIKK